jgi:hypothetical protein
MGDPTPGQIPDNIFTSVQQLKLKGNEVGSAGDLLVKDSGGFWRRADTASDDVIVDGFAQARVDFDTTGVADGAIAIESLASPSYIYTFAGAAIANGAIVKLNPASVTGPPAFDIAQTFIEAVVADIATGKVRGKFSRVATDSAGNNDAAEGDVIIVKLGVN